MQEREGHDKLHYQLVKKENRPCSRCGSLEKREIHRLVRPVGYVRDNVQVLCHDCHCGAKGVHYQGKFQVGDKVYLNGRTPAFLDLPRHRPRTIRAITYDPVRQANLYVLGSNGMGACAGEPATNGYAAYSFRSYQLMPWHSLAKGQHGRPRNKRPYHSVGKASKSNLAVSQDFHS